MVSSAKSVLITGCSSGIGRQLSFFLREKGWLVYPTTRTEHDAEGLRKEGFDSFQLDVNSSDSLQGALRNILEKTGGSLTAVINNAGFELIGAVEDLPREAIREQFETNVFGAMELARFSIPVMRKQSFGRILFIGSVACSRVAFPFSGAYCASRYALSAFVDSLRRELSGTAIAVSLIEPGLFKTNNIDTSKAMFSKWIEKNESRYSAIYNKMFTFFKRVSVGLPENDISVLLNAIYRTLESKNPKSRVAVPLKTAFIYGAVHKFCPDWMSDLLLLYKMRYKDKIL